MSKTVGGFSVHAIAGTHVILLAMDCPEPRRHGLLGFAIGRRPKGAPASETTWLDGLKVFKSKVPNPKPGRRYSVRRHPIQSFLWSDYTAKPGRSYTVTVIPMCGAPAKLKPEPAIEIDVQTEKEVADGHGIWFNRGAIAGQSFARKFGNRPPTEEEQNDPGSKVNEWLSRGLVKACLTFIDTTPPGDSLHLAAYEFTYAPVLAALKGALDRGVDVRILYHDTSREAGRAKGANEKAIAEAALPEKVGNRKILFPRAKTKIPHNKFIVRSTGATKPASVWTGSTNFTPSGFLGQANVGHLVEDAATARQYLKYWRSLRDDPDRDTARAKAVALTPDPPALVDGPGTTLVFSPRPESRLLQWYGDRIEDAAGTVMLTAAFGVTPTLVAPLAAERDILRFILMEKPPTAKVRTALTKDRDLQIAYGAVLGELYEFKNGKPTARRDIEEFELDKWFLEEEHYRKKNEGFVFFVHTKFLLIDPLSDDPLVCTGSANFSPGSLLQNDENMLLIRGDTRVADIYLTEFDRLFRHFYFRRIANELHADGDRAKAVFLSEDSSWTDAYFKAGWFKCRRRELFFGDPTVSWVTGAAARG